MFCAQNLGVDQKLGIGLAQEKKLLFKEAVAFSCNFLL